MSLVSNHPLEFLSLLLIGEITEKFSTHGAYTEFHNHLQELIDDLALDHVANIHARCAECEYEVGQYEEALSFIENVRSLQPPNHLTVGRAKKILGYICLKQGNLDTGQIHLQEAIANFKHNFSVEQLVQMKTELESLHNEMPVLTAIIQTLLSQSKAVLENLTAS